MESKNCLFCGNTFYKPIYESKNNWKNRHKFCSKKCKKDSQKGIKKTEEECVNRRKHSRNRTCEYCGSYYESRDQRRKYCSHSCGVEANRGENSYLWRGGIDKGYGKNWNNALRIKIRERDFYTCQICGKVQGDISHHVHHIDYNKRNCDENNLITLCPNCHTKTNGNRNYWKEFFATQLVA